jgi:hypothetical protein
VIGTNILAIGRHNHYWRWIAIATTASTTVTSAIITIHRTIKKFTLFDEKRKWSVSNVQLVVHTFYRY